MKREHVLWPAERAARSGPTSQPSAGQAPVTLFVSDAESVSALVERDIKDNMKTAKLHQQKERVVLWKAAIRSYAEFSETRSDLEEGIPWAKALGIKVLDTTIEGFKISVPDWCEKPSRHVDKDIVAWRMTGLSTQESALLEKWVEDVTHIRTMSRDTKSRQDKFFAQLSESVFGKTNLDTPESILSSLKSARSLMEAITSGCVDPTATDTRADSSARQTSSVTGRSKAADGEGVDLDALLASLSISDDTGSSGDEVGEAGRLMDQWDNLREADSSEGDSVWGDGER